jgi:hypothetical protein
MGPGADARSSRVQRSLSVDREKRCQVYREGRERAADIDIRGYEVIF